MTNTTNLNFTDDEKVFLRRWYNEGRHAFRNKQTKELMQGIGLLFGSPNRNPLKIALDGLQEKGLLTYKYKCDYSKLSDSGMAFIICDVFLNENNYTIDEFADIAEQYKDFKYADQM